MNHILPEESINRGIHGRNVRFAGILAQILAEPLAQIGLAPGAVRG